MVFELPIYLFMWDHSDMYNLIEYELIDIKQYNYDANILYLLEK